VIYKIKLIVLTFLFITITIFQLLLILFFFTLVKIGGGYPAYEQPPPSFRQQGSQQGSFNGSSSGNGYGGPPSSGGYGGPSSFGGNCLILNKYLLFSFSTDFYYIRLTLIV
jgi:hypothetical protein